MLMEKFVLPRMNMNFEVVFFSSPSAEASVENLMTGTDQ